MHLPCVEGRYGGKTIRSTATDLRELIYLEVSSGAVLKEQGIGAVSNRQHNRFSPVARTGACLGSCFRPKRAGLSPSTVRLIEIEPFYGFIDRANVCERCPAQNRQRVFHIGGRAHAIEDAADPRCADQYPESFPRQGFRAVRVRQ